MSNRRRPTHPERMQSGLGPKSVPDSGSSSVSPDGVTSFHLRAATGNDDQMPLPMMCRRCHQASMTKLRIPAEGDVNFLNCTWVCPLCGGPAPLPDVLVLKNEETGRVRALRWQQPGGALPAGMTYRELEGLASTAQGVLDGSVAPDDLRVALQSVRSEVVRGLPEFVPRTKAHWTVVATLIVALLALIPSYVAMVKPDDTLTDSDLAPALVEILEQRVMALDRLRDEVARQDRQLNHQHQRRGKRNAGRESSPPALRSSDRQLDEDSPYRDDADEVGRS